MNNDDDLIPSIPPHRRVTQLPALSSHHAARQRASRRRLFVLAALGVFAAGSAIATATVMPAPAHIRGPAAHMLAIQEVRSESGITAWLVEDHSLPVIALGFAFRNAGASHDPLPRQGLSLLASNTMDEGAGPHDSQTFQKLLADNSIALSFGSGRDDFGGNLRMLARHRDLAFGLLKTALQSPRFDAEAVDRMRAANIARVRNAVSDPDWIAARIMNDVAYDGHPYAMNVGGTLTTLAAITPDELHEFVKTRLSRENLQIAVTGAITANELRAAMDDIFAVLPPAQNLPEIAAGNVQNAGQHVHYDMDIPQTIIEIMMGGIKRDDPDYYAAAVMDFIFGGSGFGSRLTEEVREKRGLTYGISSGFITMKKIQSYRISTSTQNDKAAEVLQIIRAEMQRMSVDGITPKELTDAQNYLIGSMPLSLSSTANITAVMMGLQGEDLPMDYLDQRAAKIRAVTAADVQRVAQRFLTPDQMTIVTVGRPENLTPDRVITELPHVD